jgi:hypothetical protein
MRTRTTTLLGTLAVSAGLIAGGAFLAPVLAQTNADTTMSSQADWLTIPQLYERLEAAGYTAIDEIEREDDGYEVKATDRDGRRVEIDVHPITGEVLKTEVKRDKRSGDRSDMSDDTRSMFMPRTTS